jgi:hypothetical protein
MTVYKPLKNLAAKNWASKTLVLAPSDASCCSSHAP